MQRISSTSAGRTRVVPIGLVLLAFAACHDSPSTSAPAITSVTVTPDAATLELGARVQLQWAPRDASGHVVTGRPVSWSSSAPLVASVSASGLVTGVTLGQALVTATSEGKTGEAMVAVVPPAVATITLRPSPALVAVGGTIDLGAVPRDARGAQINDKVVSFESSDATIATVSTTGRIRGLLAGSVTITASADGVTSTTAATVVDPTTLGGQVFTADGGAPGGLQFEVRTGAGQGLQTFAAALQGTGEFQLGAPLLFGDADSVDLIVDAIGSARTYHPTMVRAATADAAPIVQRPLVVPRSVAFTSASYPEATLDVSMQDAFTRVCADDNNANCNSFYPKRWKSVVSLWRESDLPIALAFDRTASTSDISKADSVAFWTVVHQMEGDFGRPLFRPVNLSDLPPPSASGLSMWAVLVSVDSTLLPTYGGYTNWYFVEPAGIVYAAKTRIARSDWMGDRRLVTHELLHALGFHHTCAWSSVMGGYGCPNASSATIGDAAAFTLAYDIKRTIIANGPTTTLADALLGETLLEPSASPSLVAPPNARLVPFFARVRRTLVVNGQVVIVDGAP